MTAPVQLDPADLVALVDLVKSAGFTQASYEPSKVKVLPGVWIRLDQVDTVDVIADGCAVVTTTLHLVVGSKPVDDALVELLPLYDELCEVLTPTGPFTVVAVDLGTGPLPALAVPYETRTIPTEESP